MRCWPHVLVAAAAAPAKRRQGTSQWSTPVVVVPAHYREWGRSPPWATKLPPWASLYIYQRTKKGAPRYSPNYGYEAGVHLQFIKEHYDDLPELVVFTQAKPTQHNPLFFDALKCLNSKTNYTSLNWNYQTRGTTYWRKFALQGVVEQCWRDLLDAFGVRLPPKKEPVASFYCCAQMAASRDMIRRHPRSAYEKAYAMLGGAGACHEGELDWQTLSVYASSRTRKWDAPRYNRHTAGAWEHLNHVILGGEPLNSRRRARARIPRCAPSDFGSRWRIARETPSTQARRQLDSVEVDKPSRRHRRDGEKPS